MPDTSVGMGYWIDKEDGRRAIARVHVRYDLVFLERPLLKAFLQLDPTLWDLQIIRNPRGTNFPVTDSEWAAVKLWLDITN